MLGEVFRVVFFVRVGQAGAGTAIANVSARHVAAFGEKQEFVILHMFDGLRMMVGCGWVWVGGFGSMDSVDGSMGGWVWFDG